MQISVSQIVKVNKIHAPSKYQLIREVCPWANWVQRNLKHARTLTSQKKVLKPTLFSDHPEIIAHAAFTLDLEWWIWSGSDAPHEIEVIMQEALALSKDQIRSWWMIHSHRQIRSWPVVHMWKQSGSTWHYADLWRHVLSSDCDIFSPLVLRVGTPHARQAYALVVPVQIYIYNTSDTVYSAHYIKLHIVQLFLCKLNRLILCIYCYARDSFSG